MPGDEAATKKEAPEGPTAQFSDAAGKLRDTAKWLVAAFGALGAALITSLSVSNLGQLAGTHLILATLGFGLGLIGTAGVIFAIARVLLVTTTSIIDISGPGADPKLVASLERQTALLGGFKGVEVLATTHVSAQRQRIENYELMVHAENKPTAPGAELRFQLAEKELKLTDPIITRVLGFAGFMRLRRRFMDALIATAIGIVLVGSGIGLFAFYGSATPEAANEKAAIAGQPVEAIVNLNDLGEKTLRSALGSGCDLNHLRVLAVAATADSADVVTVPGRSCAVDRFTVTPDVGTVCPVDSALRPALPPDPGEPGVGLVVC